nr:hypothetical protein [Tanacetum cinerariifolium]
DARVSLNPSSVHEEVTGDGSSQESRHDVPKPPMAGRVVLNPSTPRVVGNEYENTGIKYASNDFNTSIDSKTDELNEGIEEPRVLVQKDPKQAECFQTHNIDDVAKYATLSELTCMPKGALIDDEPIVQSVDIVTKTTSYVGAASSSTKEQPKVNSNFRPLVADPVFEGVNIFVPRKDVEKAGLEAVLESGPWMTRNTPIILKKWSMSTSLLKEELTRIPIWDSWGRISVSWCLIEVNSEADLVDVVTIGVPSLTGDDFTKETIHVEYEWRPPRCDECKIFGHVHDQCPKKVVTPPIVSTSNVVTPTVEKANDGFQTVGKKKKKKGKSKTTNDGQFVGPVVKQNVRYEPKANISAPKEGVTNVSKASTSSSMLKSTGTSTNNDSITSSNSFSTLNVKEEKDVEVVENVFDETANLFSNTKQVGVLLSRLLLVSLFS